MTYEITGLEKLNKPGQLIIANHPTLIDIVFLISRLPSVSCIVKEKLWHNPCMKGSIMHAGYIRNGDPEKMIDDCVEYLNGGGRLVIFPEGTRTVPGTERYKFQRGAAVIALSSKAILTPVIVTCTPSTLSKSEKWYQIPSRPFHLAMHVQDDLNVEEFTLISPRPIAVRRFNAFLQEYFTEKKEFYEKYGR